MNAFNLPFVLALFDVVVFFSLDVTCSMYLSHDTSSLVY